MGYWRYEATESDSALDYMVKITEQLEKLWDEAEDYGEKMAVVYVLTEAPAVDMTDYRGLKAKAAAYVAERTTLLKRKPLANSIEAFNERCEQITYLLGLVEKLQTKQGTTLVKLLERIESSTGQRSQ
jgi:hypothetical protein